MSNRILVINPGGLSTKIAVYDNKEEILKTTIYHDQEQLAAFDKVTDQFDMRAQYIHSTLDENNIPLTTLQAVVGRGGLLKPITGGVWTVNEAMIKDLKEAKRGEHASNLGAMIAYTIAWEFNIPAYIVDPVVVDELEDIARYSGMPELPRLSIFHALNQKATARKAAEKLNKEYSDLNLIVAHLGSGISIGAHGKGKVIEVNNALNGEGPLSPERCGTLPAGQLADLCFSGKYTQKEIHKKIKGNGGLKAYTGTSDCLEIEKKMEKGDAESEKLLKAMAYQVSREIGSLAPVFSGHVDAIVLTGALAYSDPIIQWISDRIEFIAPVMVFPGENELESLRDGTLRVLNGEEKSQEYH